MIPHESHNPTTQALRKPELTSRQAEALQQQLAQALMEVERLKSQTPQIAVPQDENHQPALEELPAEEAMAALSQNPVGFIRQLIHESADKHLARLKEEAELAGALRLARKNVPDFAQFEQFVLQEVAELIKTDEDGVIDPWETLFEKGMTRFREKFRDTLKNNPKLLVTEAAEQVSEKSQPHVEGSTPRKMPALPPSFTRQQIARMTTEDFLKNEAAIEDAMKNGRIR